MATGYGIGGPPTPLPQGRTNHWKKRGFDAPQELFAGDSVYFQALGALYNLQMDAGRGKTGVKE